MKRIIAIGYLIAVITNAIFSAYGDTLCSGESAEMEIDLSSSTRIAPSAMLIHYSTEWVIGAPSNALVVVEVNGEVLNTAAGTGFVEWTPIGCGAYILTHRVMSGETQYGETLTITFFVEEALCSGESMPKKIDLTPGTRTAEAMETIRFSTEWTEDVPTGADAVVEVNGALLNSAAGTGFVEWTPMSNGTYTLAHKVMMNGTLYGELLTAIFVVTGVTFTATQTTAVPVPYAWLRLHNPSMEDEYEAYEASAKASAANGRKVWECYVLGLDPEVATNDFRIVSFPMKADGTPDLAGIVVDPPQGQWNLPATWKVKGAATLEGPWEDVPAGGGALGESALPLRFFKVEVVLP